MSVEADSTYFLFPAGPTRRVVSSNPATAAVVISVLIVVITSVSLSAQRGNIACANPVDGAVHSA